MEAWFNEHPHMISINDVKRFVLKEMHVGLSLSGNRETKLVEADFKCKRTNNK